MTPAQLAKNSTVRVTPGAFGANCKLANGTDADHDINIGVGSCGDSTGTYQMTLLSTLVKQIDAGWAQGSAAGGLFSGSVATGTWYHVFVIRNDTTGAIDGGFDTSATAANRPAGWTAYCRVGAVLTDGSSNILVFFQNGDQVAWPATINIGPSTAPTSSTLIAVQIPLGVVTKWFGTIYASNASSNVTYQLCDANGSTQNYNPVATQVGGLGVRMAIVGIISDTSSQIRHYASAASTTIYISTNGYIDPRGKVAA